MRMHLYEVEIEHADGTTVSCVVAPSEPRAVELVREHYTAVGRDWTEVSIERIDKELKGRRRIGLDNMLRNAPVGFASFHPAIGWAVHAAALHRLRLFRIEEMSGRETYVIAPDQDIAGAILAGQHPLVGEEVRMFRVFDAVPELSEAQTVAVETMLEFGPIGVVEWVDEAWHAK